MKINMNKVPKTKALKELNDGDWFISDEGYLGFIVEDGCAKNVVVFRDNRPYFTDMVYSSLYSSDTTVACVKDIEINVEV